VWGEDCYKDIMAVTDFISQRDDVNDDSMAAFGCSFGGYMTNLIGVKTDRFRCLISQASIFSISNFYANTDFPGYWYRALAMTNHPFNDLDHYDQHSPHRLIQNWKSPTLIAHGEKDYRSPISESLALFESLLYHGVEAEFIVFPDESHGLVKPRNVEAWYDAIVDYPG
jgi:dipeptidyl aminopeptidase/acylaminoacyl peptidase